MGAFVLVVSGCFFVFETFSCSKICILKILKQAVIGWGRHGLLAWDYRRRDRMVENHDAEGKDSFLITCIICKTRRLT